VKIFPHHAEEAAAPPSVAATSRRHFRLAGLAAIVAVIAFAFAGAVGDIHGSFNAKLAAAIGGVVFIVTAVIAIRLTARETYEVLGARNSPKQAGIIRWLITITGYLIVLFCAFGIFGVPVHQLLVGGAITGVVIGIAGQQSLGNVFAGVMILLARPFSIGDAIIVHNGSINGPIEGTVTSMGMSYVSLLTDNGPLQVPNAVMLASAVGPLPGSGYRWKSRVTLETPQQIREQREAHDREVRDSGG
jgi:small conductance mechanosensitive channel